MPECPNFGIISGLYAYFDIISQTGEFGEYFSFRLALCVNEHI